MRIFYGLSSYISHKTAGLDYIGCLKSLGYEVVTAPEDALGADMAILHDEPTTFPALFQKIPSLKKIRVVGYCVWEGDILPEAFIPGLELVDEIWTCSAYCRESFLRRFEKVFVVPHIIKRVKVDREALKQAEALVGKSVSDEFLFFSVVDAANPRKNIQSLIKAFIKVRQNCRRPLRLVLKQYRLPVDFSSVPGVQSIIDDLPAEVIHAMHMLCNAYVSAHHTEGWGLGLSEAMAYGKPVIATGYSGNMEFMNKENSYPVGFSLGKVSSEMCKVLPLFTSEMTWANVDEDELAAKMLFIAENGFSSDIAGNARMVVEKFGSVSVAGMIKSLLEQ